MTLSPLQELARLELEPCRCDPLEFGQCDRCYRMAVLEAELGLGVLVCPFCGNDRLDEDRDLCPRCNEYVVPIERREFDGVAA